MPVLFTGASGLLNFRRQLTALFWNCLVAKRKVCFSKCFSFTLLGSKFPENVEMFPHIDSVTVNEATLFEY